LNPLIVGTGVIATRGRIFICEMMLPQKQISQHLPSSCNVCRATRLVIARMQFQLPELAVMIAPFFSPNASPQLEFNMPRAFVTA